MDCQDEAWRNSDDRPRLCKTLSAGRLASRLGQETILPAQVARCTPARCAVAPHCCRKSLKDIGCQCPVPADSTQWDHAPLRRKLSEVDRTKSAKDQR